MDLALLCTLFFTTGSVVAVGGTLFPQFQEKIMDYGSRKRTATSSPDASSWDRLLTMVASFQVPHTWFTHYYIVFVASSIFWALQIAYRGAIFQFIASYTKPSNGAITINQIVTAWILMLLHGLRRLYESITLTKASSAKMWFGIWLIGALYYVFIGVSIWIDGADILNKENCLSDVALSYPSSRTVSAILLFVVASQVQHICHTHLASLRKYSVPQHRFFRSIVCPHYTSECFIYLALAMVCAPRDRILNATVSAGFLFVASNLAVTADSTWKWYCAKFGPEAVRNRWRMVPYIY